jgi:hypothetical protein
MARKTKTLAEQLAELDNPAPKGMFKSLSLKTAISNKHPQTSTQKRNRHKTTATKMLRTPTTMPQQQENTTSKSARASYASAMSFPSDPDTMVHKSAEMPLLEKTKTRMIRSARALMRKRVRMMLKMLPRCLPLRVKMKMSVMKMRICKMETRALLPI